MLTKRLSSCATFSDRMRPVDGYPLYPVSLEGVERKAMEELPQRERDAFREQIALLARYIEDPNYARSRRVRMIEGEAKYTLLEPGYLYTVSQQAAGGMVLDRERIGPGTPGTRPGGTQ